MCKLILATSLIDRLRLRDRARSSAWYGGNPFEQYTFRNRMFGPYGWCFGTMIACNVLIPQLFWFRWFRTTPWAMFVIAIFVNIGMWFERFVIVATSLAPRLPAVELEDVLPDLGRLPPARGRVRAVHDAVSALHPVPADGRHQRGEGVPARGRPASPRGMGSRNRSRPIPPVRPLPSSPSLARVSACWRGSPGRPSCWPRPGGCTRPGIAGSTPIRRSRSMAWSGRSGCAGRGSRCSCSPVELFGVVFAQWLQWYQSSRRLTR